MEILSQKTKKSRVNFNGGGSLISPPGTNISLIKAAKSYIDLGYSVLAIDADKHPALDAKCNNYSWKHLQSNLTTHSEITRLLNLFKAKGVGIIAGKVSGNLEILDIDSKNELVKGSLWGEYRNLLIEHAPELYKKLVIAETVNNGYHLVFRHTGETVSGNREIARRPATAAEQQAEKEKKGSSTKSKVLIETRGEGGYFAAEPTPGYRFIQGDLSSVQTITDEERNLLYSIASSFDTMPVEVEQKEKTVSQTFSNNGLSPFEDYNERGDTPALLQKHGWSRVSERDNHIHFKRPGNTDSKQSATYFKDKKIFYVFSTSTEFASGKGFNPVGVYSTLEHNGDFSAASKALLKEGYGTAFEGNKSKASEPAAKPESVEFEAEPKPLDLTLKPVEQLESDSLPTVLVEWLKPASKVIGCPFDFMVLGAIVMIGTLIGSRLRVKPITVSDWFVVPNLYAGLVGLPSSRKTPALDEIRKPILELQAKARKEFAEKKKDFEIEATYFEREKQSIYKEKLNLQETKTKIKELAEPVIPSMKRFETNDITTPKLAHFLSENPNGLLQFRDELTGWLKSLEADYDTNARTLILELWKGAVTYSKARVGDGEIFIQSGTLSILGGVQPSKLLRYVAEAYSFDNSDGFLQRFLFTYPDALKQKEKPTQADYEAMQKGFKKINELCKSLVEFDFEGKTLGENGDQFHIVKFSPEAQGIADDWKSEIEAEAEALEIEDEAFSSYLYKLPKSCFAIALIFHCLENIDKRVFPDEISEATILKAITYSEVLQSHARRVFALGENQIFALAQIVIGKIKKGDLPQGFTIREVVRKQWSGLRSKDIVLDVLQVLNDYGWIKEAKSEGGGRPTSYFYYHNSLTPKAAPGGENE